MKNNDTVAGLSTEERLRLENIGLRVQVLQGQLRETELERVALFGDIRKRLDIPEEGKIRLRPDGVSIDIRTPEAEEEGSSDE